MNSIERLHNDSKSASYKTTCDCHSDDHALTFWIDRDEDFQLSLYFNVIGPYPYTWEGSSWAERLWHRICGAVKILFTGHVVYQEAFMFRNKDHVKDFIKALDEALLP